MGVTSGQMVQDPKQAKGGEVRVVTSCPTTALGTVSALTPAPARRRPRVAHRTAFQACLTVHERCRSPPRACTCLCFWQQLTLSPQAGALDGNPEDLRAQNKAGAKAFTGQGRTLSGAPGADAGPAAPQGGTGAGPLQPIVHTIVFYRNGALTQLVRMVFARLARVNLARALMHDHVARMQGSL